MFLAPRGQAAFPVFHGPAWPNVFFVSMTNQPPAFWKPG